MTTISWTDTMAHGVAQHLADAGVVAWSPDAPYDGTGTLPCAFTGTLPDDPERAVAIKVRPFAPSNGVTQVGVQIVVRDPADLGGTAQAIVDQLHDAHELVLPPYRLPHVWLQSWGDDLTDQAGTPVVSLNFYSWARFTGLGTRD